MVYGICIEYTVFTSPYIVFTEKNPSNNKSCQEALASGERVNSRFVYETFFQGNPQASLVCKKKEDKEIQTATGAIIVRIKNQNNMCINFSCGSIFSTNKNTLSLATLGSIFLLWTSFVWCQKLLSHCR